jgi:hypothetical protein
MTYFEPSARVPLLVHYPKLFKPHRVPENVSTLDILPTLVDIAGTKLLPGLPMDGASLLPQLQGRCGSDTVFGEYCGEGTIAPLMMIRRGPWKFVICPADSPQLYNLEDDPLELRNLANRQKVTDSSGAIAQILDDFTKEAHAKWDFGKIAEDVRRSQHRRRFIWKALKQGKFTSWDYNPPDDGREKYALPLFPYICYMLTLFGDTFAPTFLLTIWSSEPGSHLSMHTAETHSRSVKTKLALTVSSPEVLKSC